MQYGSVLGSNGEGVVAVTDIKVVVIVIDFVEGRIIAVEKVDSRYTEGVVTAP